MGNRVHITASNWQLLSPLVDDALALEPEARSAWLDAQTQLSEAVHAQLAELIAVANAPETNTVLRTLPSLAADPTTSAPPMTARSAGDVVGVYTLLRVIGRGGMAEVWLARRNDGAYERDIALKLPLSHLPLNHATERLLRERNVLAVLEHPSIARLYDAGVTLDGQPFLAMEYVEGESIRDYADHRQLGLLARCKLVLQVLDALQYAHQHLVVHRDLKPGNILVRADGRVALLDFGIAKVLEATDHCAEQTELTRAAGNALTLAYAAPEQLLGEAVTTGVDIYSAGIVLFELLTGHRPFHGAEHNSATLLRAMEGVARASFERKDIDAAARHGAASARVWQQAYAGDLAAICARALRREPAERYASALSFREDLIRYFNHEPVLARGGAMSYYWRKFVERNRMVLAISLAALLLTSALAIHGWRKNEALQQRSSQLAMLDRVLTSVFDGMTPSAGESRHFTGKELADRAAAVLLAGPATTSDSRGDVTRLVAKLYLNVGALEDGIRLLEIERADARTALDVRREASALCALTNAYTQTKRAARALELLLEMRPRARAVISEPDALLAEIDFQIGETHHDLGDIPQATLFAERARAHLRLLDDEPKALLVDILAFEARLARRRGDLQAAAAALTEARLHVAAANTNVSQRWALSNELLAVEVSAGHYKEAAAVGTALMAEFAGRLAPDDAWNFPVALQLALALMRSGQMNQAAALVERVKTQSANHPGDYLYRARIIEAQIALYRGQSKVAAESFRALLAERDNANGTADTERTRRFLALSLLQQDDTEGALSLLKTAESRQMLMPASNQADLALTRAVIGAALIRDNDLSGARRSLSAAESVLRQSRGDAHYGTLLAQGYLALLDATPENSTARYAIADRIDAELGWQFGASTLANLLRSATPLNAGNSSLPALL